MKNILIGFLMATCIFLMIGATLNNEVTVIKNGRYQISTSIWGDSVSIFETIIDTRSGEIIKRDKIKLKHYNKM